MKGILIPYLVNIFRTDNLYILYYTLYFFQSAGVDNQKLHAGLLYNLGQSVATESRINSKHDRIAETGTKRGIEKFGSIIHIDAKSQSLIFVQFTTVHQLFSYVQKETLVTPGLQINFPISIFMIFKYEKYAITPEPKPPHGHLYHIAEIYEAQHIS